MMNLAAIGIYPILETNVVPLNFRLINSIIFIISIIACKKCTLCLFLIKH